MSEPYLIRKRGAWYRADCRGYTHHVRDAGIYDEAFARKEVATEPDCMEAVSLRDYEKLLVNQRREIDDKLAILRGSAEPSDGREA